MTKASDNAFPSVLFAPSGIPAAPTSSQQRLYYSVPSNSWYSIGSNSVSASIGVPSIAVSSNTITGPITLVAQGTVGLTTSGSSIQINAVAGSGGGSGMTNPMTTTGDMIYSSSGTTPGRLAVGAAGTVLKGGTTPSWSTAGEFATAAARVETNEVTASTTYTDLATSGPSVTVTIGASGNALVLLNANHANSDNIEYTGAVSVAISGATTTAASDAWMLNLPGNTGSRSGGSHLFTGLAAGSTTFKLQYKRSNGTGNANFQTREIIVCPVL